jgi:arabinogalactan endo-1,4-beta-galactosidase
MDLSYQPFLDNYDFDYKDEQGQVIDNVIQWVSDNGVNLVRIRLFHNPLENDPVMNASNLQNVIQLSKKVKASGNKILLDFHYSDTWADPGKQFTPSAWSGLSFDILSDSLYEYTKNVLFKMHSEGVMPDMVQIGNETNNGFLWDHAKLWIGNDDDNWPNYTILVKRALSAVGYVEQQTGSEIKTIIHFAGLKNVDYFFQKMYEYGVGYDIIGISHYHNWHNQDLDEVASILSDLANEQGKQILIVETRYPFTLGWNDWTHNIIGEESQLIPGYPATEVGQKEYFINFVNLIKGIPNNKGIGFVYWAPDMLAFDGPESTSGSSWENLSTWDFENKALPVFEVFRQY